MKKKKPEKEDWDKLHWFWHMDLGKVVRYKTKKGRESKSGPMEVAYPPLRNCKARRWLKRIRL
jgi:hypothetical protein